MCRLVEAKGWILQRIYSKAGVPKVISIPLHGSRDLKPGLADRIARDAGVEL
jgi:predicted RNA binding protein YcfA (HicA-like mRNA interferase family)